MKNSILFKTLIDIFYFIHLSGLILIVICLPFGVINPSIVKIQGINPEHFGFIHWALLFITVIAYIIFLRGLFYLRKVARFLLSKGYFTETVILNLKKTGTHFISTGIVYFIIILSLLLLTLSKGKIEIGYDFNLLAALFVTIIGLFFTMFSKTLALAKVFKEENELTV